MNRCEALGEQHGWVFVADVAGQHIEQCCNCGLKKLTKNTTSVEVTYDTSEEDTINDTKKADDIVKAIAEAVIKK